MKTNTDQLTGIGWPPNELQKIAASDDLHISPLRDDGLTYGTPTWIWSVVIDGELYVRAYNGRQSRWYQTAMRQKAGRIRAAGMTKNVVFERVDGPINDQIDDAYGAKYGGSQYLPPMIGARARAATVRVLPRRRTEYGWAYRTGEVNSRLELAIICRVTTCAIL